MIWKLLAAPVMGALIGYCTNWIAVKMLFRPREAKYLFGIKLPFTPGVIPKGKKRLAEAVNKVVNEQLLTKEAIEERLLSAEMLHMVRAGVNERIALIKSDGTKTVKELLRDIMSISADAKGAAALPRPAADCAAERPEEQMQEVCCKKSAARACGTGSSGHAEEGLSSGLHALSDITVYDDAAERRAAELAGEAKAFVTKRIFERISGAGLGQIAADTVTEKLGEALSGSLLGHMMGGSVTQMMGPAVAQTVDGYIAEHGEELIAGMVGNEIDSLLDMRAADIISAIEKNGADPGEKAADIYAAAVKRKSSDVIELLDAGGIIRETIENMDNRQLEELVMSTMKTELGAVVNFGAVIGLVLGLVNMFIYIFF